MPYVLTPGLPNRSPVHPGRGTVIGYLSKQITTEVIIRHFQRVPGISKNGHPPDRLVSEPACVTLVKAVLKSSPQLFGRSDGGTSNATGFHCSRKVQRVSARFCSVVEHHTWKKKRSKDCEESDKFSLSLLIIQPQKSMGIVERHQNRDTFSYNLKSGNWTILYAVKSEAVKQNSPESLF